MTVKLLALSLLALFVLSIVAIPLSSFALTPATFTDQPTFTSLNSDRWSKVWTDDRSQAIVFNGIDQSLTAANNGVYDVTTEDFWTGGLIQTTSNPANSVIERKRGSAEGYSIQINASRNLLVLLDDGSASAIIITLTTHQIQDNRWYAWAVSFDRDANATLFLYDLSTGTLFSTTGSISAQQDSLSNAQTFHVARNSAASTLFFPGRIDMLIPPQIGATLSEEQFLQMAQGNFGAIAFSNLYDFNAGNANDIIGSNHLTMNGAPTFTSDVADISPITGTYFVDVNQGNFKSVLVSPWGSIHRESTATLSASSNPSAVSDVEFIGDVRRVYTAQQLSTTVLNQHIVNIDTGALINSVNATLTTTTAISGAPIGVATTKNAVYYTTAGTSTATNFGFHHSNRDLTGFTTITTTYTGVSTDRVTDLTVVTNGAALADDVLYFFDGTTNAVTPRIGKLTSVSASNIGSLGTAHAQSNLQLTNVSDKILVRFTQDGTTKLFSVTKASDTISSQLFGNAWNTRTNQQYNFDGTTITFKSGEIAYFATPAKAISYSPTGVLTDPAIRYIEDTASSTLSGISNTFYRLSDSLVVTGSGTTWTPKTITGVHITPTPFSEPIAAPPVQNHTLFNDNVVRLACDANYLLGSHVVVGDDSDCTTWIVLPTSAADVGRQLPYSRTTELVHANPLTAYTVNVFTNEPIDLGINVLYHNKLVDTNVFGDDDNAQIRLLYGNCYTTQYVQLDTDEIVQTGQFCAADQSTIQAIIRADLGFTFWNVHWGVVHDWDFDTKIVDLIVRHKSFPYTYDVKIFNATGTAIVDVTQNSANEIHITDYNLSAFAAQGPFRLDVYRGDNGNRIYSQHLTDGGLDSILEPIFAVLGDIEFAGWGIMMFLPIIFAAMFTRSTVGIGGGMLVAFIGVLVFMGIIAMEEGAIWLITFVAVVGLIAYRVIRQ